MRAALAALGALLLLQAAPARADVDVGAGLGPDMFAYRARRVPDLIPAHPIALALEDVFGEEVWKAVEVSTNGPAYDLSYVIRRGYYKSEVIQLILMSLDADLTLSQAVEKRAKGTPLSELAAALGLDYDDVLERALAVEAVLDEEFLPWYREGSRRPQAAAAPEPAERAGGSEAYALLEGLVRTGARYAGAPGRAEAVEALAREMESRGLAVERQPFLMDDPKGGRTWEMVNLIGRVNPGASCRFLLGSHFDTRHVAEEDPEPGKRSLPIPGANDGTSGVAVLLALAPRLPALLPSGVGADIVLFDGEEMGYPEAGGYCGGSRHMAKHLPGNGAKPRFGIVLDMVCDPRGVYRTEFKSMQTDKRLVEALWDIGEGLEPAAFSREPISIIDDHVALSLAGVPSVLLIGFNYPEWHTTRDGVDKCSAGRLGLVQDVLERFIERRLGDFLGGCRS